MMERFKMGNISHERERERFGRTDAYTEPFLKSIEYLPEWIIYGCTYIPQISICFHLAAHCMTRTAVSEDAITSTTFLSAGSCTLCVSMSSPYFSLSLTVNPNSVLATTTSPLASSTNTMNRNPQYTLHLLLLAESVARTEMACGVYQMSLSLPPMSWL